MVLSRQSTACQAGRAIYQLQKLPSSAILGLSWVHQERPDLTMPPLASEMRAMHVSNTKKCPCLSGRAGPLMQPHHYSTLWAKVIVLEAPTTRMKGRDSRAL